MPRPTELSKREKLFCRQYVASNNGAASAVTAGYSKAGAKVTAFRLLKRRVVREEINRLKALRSKAVNAVLTGAVTGARVAINGQKMRTAKLRAELDEDMSASLSRAYLIAGLMENFEVALGRRTVKRIRMIGRGAKQTEVEVQVYEPNPAAAVGTAKLLLDEVAFRERAAVPGMDGNPYPVPELEARLANAMAAFRKAGEAEREKQRQRRLPPPSKDGDRE